MKLYDVDRGTRIKIIDDNVKTPIGSHPIKKGEEMLFSRIDGMYSLCIRDDKASVHPAAWTEVEIID